MDQIETEPAIKRLEQVSTALTFVSVGIMLYRIGYVHSRLESIRLREAEE